MTIQTHNVVSEQTQRHAEKVSQTLKDQARQLRSEISNIEDARCQVLCETTAEVLLGLAKAHDDFVAGSEPGMKFVEPTD